MEDNYSKAYKEITEIFKYVPKETLNKIPQEMRDMFEDKKSKTYNFKIDTTKPFEEQELLEETKAILSNVFRDYLANDNQKIKIQEIENQQRIEWERQKRERYNPDNIFKSKNIQPENKIQENYEQKSIIIIKEEKWYKKIFAMLKNLFRKN